MSNVQQNAVLTALQRINDEIIKLVGMAVSVTVPAPAPAQAPKQTFAKEDLFKENKSVLVVQNNPHFSRLDGPLISGFIVTGRVAGKARHAEVFESRKDADTAADKMDSCSVWSADVKMAQGPYASLWGRKPYAYVATKKLLFRRNGTKITFEEELYSLA